MKPGLKKYFVILTAILFLSSLIQMTEASKTYGISQISITPGILQQNENMTVSVGFEDSSQIEMVKLLVCQLEPEYKCDAFPTIMQEKESNVYSTNYLIAFERGTVVGITLILVYDNETTVHLPETSEFMGLEVVEPSSGTFYFAAGTVGEIEETSNFSFLLIGLSVLVISIVIKRRRS